MRAQRVISVLAWVSFTRQPDTWLINAIVPSSQDPNSDLDINGIDGYFSTPSELASVFECLSPKWIQQLSRKPLLLLNTLRIIETANLDGAQRLCLSIALRDGLNSIPVGGINVSLAESIFKAMGPVEIAQLSRPVINRIRTGLTNYSLCPHKAYAAVKVIMLDLAQRTWTWELISDLGPLICGAPTAKLAFLAPNVVNESLGLLNKCNFDKDISSLLLSRLLKLPVWSEFANWTESQAQSLGRLGCFLSYNSCILLEPNIRMLIPVNFADECDDLRLCLMHTHLDELQDPSTWSSEDIAQFGPLLCQMDVATIRAIKQHLLRNFLCSTLLQFPKDCAVWLTQVLLEHDLKCNMSDIVQSCQLRLLSPVMLSKSAELNSLLNKLVSDAVATSGKVGDLDSTCGYPWSPVQAVVVMQRLYAVSGSALYSSNWSGQFLRSIGSISLGIPAENFTMLVNFDWFENTVYYWCTIPGWSRSQLGSMMSAYQPFLNNSIYDNVKRLRGCIAYLQLDSYVLTSASTYAALYALGHYTDLTKIRTSEIYGMTSNWFSVLSMNNSAGFTCSTIQILGKLLTELDPDSIASSNPSELKACLWYCGTLEWKKSDRAVALLGRVLLPVLNDSALTSTDIQDLNKLIQYIPMVGSKQISSMMLKELWDSLPFLSKFPLTEAMWRDIITRLSSSIRLTTTIADYISTNVTSLHCAIAGCSANDIKKLSDQIFLTNAGSLKRCKFNTNQLSAIADRAIMMWDTLNLWSSTKVRVMGSLIVAFAAVDLTMIRIDDLSLVNYLSKLPLSVYQIRALWLATKRSLKLNMSVLLPADVLLLGKTILGTSPQELANMSSLAYLSTGNTWTSLTSWSLSQMQALKVMANRSFGSIETWQDIQLSASGAAVGVMSLTELNAVPSFSLISLDVLGQLNKFVLQNLSDASVFPIDVVVLIEKFLLVTTIPTTSPPTTVVVLTTKNIDINSLTPSSSICLGLSTVSTLALTLMTVFISSQL